MDQGGMDDGRPQGTGPFDPEDLADWELEAEPPEPGIFGDDGLAVPSDATAARASRLELSSLAVVLPTLALLPVTFVTTYPVWALANVPFDLPTYPVCFVFYLSLSSFTYVEPVQRLLLAGLFGAREPTPSERHELAPAWEAVLTEASVSEDRFVLAVIDSHDMNAAVTGGPVVSVSSGALNTLPRDELEGVLAHELGHHLGTHGFALPIAHWLVTPVAWLGEGGRQISRWGCLVTLALVALFFLGFTTLTVPLGLALVGVGLVFLVTGRIAGSLGGLVGHFSEYAADRAAVDMGFGVPLAAALDRYARMGFQDVGGTTVGQRVFGSHPPLARRLARVQARTARRARGR
jgi:Zn-dependent protease with chaperone function